MSWELGGVISKCPEATWHRSRQVSLFQTGWKLVHKAGSLQEGPAGKGEEERVKSPPLLSFRTTWFVKRYRDEKDHDPIQFVQKLPVTLKVGAEGHGPGSESLRALTYEPTEVPDLLPGLSL